jgi:hypothetical protein
MESKLSRAKEQVKALWHLSDSTHNMYKCYRGELKAFENREISENVLVTGLGENFKKFFKNILYDMNILINLHTQNTGQDCVKLIVKEIDNLRTHFEDI